jgi:hypothetical protein
LVRSFFKSDLWHRRRADSGACGGLLLFFIAFFAQALVGRGYLIAGDALYYSYPLRTVAWRMIRAGQLPLWTPYIMSGYPLLSMAQLGLGYPLTWGYLFLPGHVAEQIYILAPFLLAPVFTYAYLRELGRSPLAALLGALTFGYGGMMASPLASNGLLPNACLWLPLFLLAIERARRGSFINALLLGTCAYTMSILTGVGQGFLYVGLLAGSYALFLVLATSAPTPDSMRARLATMRQWRPVFMAGGAALLAAGVAAFQILETERVVRNSVRSALSFENFTQGAMTPALLWKSFTTPLFYVIDMHASVPPLAFALALLAVGVHVWHRRVRDARVFFWLATAGAACVLMLGQHTPVYQLIYHTPLLNRFRVPSRHTFEWTFALGVLAAYGWDTLAPVLRKQRMKRARSRVLTLYAALALLVAGIVVGVLWWLKAQTLQAGTPGWPHPTTIYRIWKGAFALLTLAALWRASLIASARWRHVLLCAIVLTLCYVEPSALVKRWWGRTNFGTNGFTSMSNATRYLRQFPPEENRVFTRVELFSEQFNVPPRLDGANLSALYGLQNVAGYEPLILARYSRALGGVGMDTLRTPDRFELNTTLFTERSHVLDLLNTTFAVTYSDLKPTLAPPRRCGELDAAGMLGELPPQATLTINGASSVAGALKLVTSLPAATGEPDGATVARLRVFTADGHIIERALQVGTPDITECGYEHSDVQAKLAQWGRTESDQTQAGGAEALAKRLHARFNFGAPLQALKIEITNVARSAHLSIYNARLVGPDDQTELTLMSAPAVAWQSVYEQNETLIMRNTRVLPRAWLVAEAEAVDSAEALRRIRGEGAQPFDPRRTALVEAAPDALRALPGGALAPGSNARIVNYEPNRLALEAKSVTPTLLVLSEINYPGWVATVDDQPTPILPTDYLLRGVALPAGRHRVELQYTAPGARIGAIISACTLLLLGGLIGYARRTR